MNAIDIAVMSEADALRITERIRYTAMSVRDGVEKLQRLVVEAQDGNAHVALGYASWTAYLADVMGDEPLRLARDDRREVVQWLAGQGMSTRAIAPIVGVDNKTVHNDIKRGVENSTPTKGDYLDPLTGEVIDAEIVESSDDEFEEAIASARQDGDLSAENVVSKLVQPNPVMGLDGKSYARAEPKPDRRKSIVDDAYAVERDLYKYLERLRTIVRDDRFNKNKANIQDALRPVAGLAREIFDDLFDNQSQED